MYAFDRGEIWSIDAAMLSASKDRIFFDETQFVSALIEYSAVLTRMGVDGPYHWIAGLEGVQDRVLTPARLNLAFPPAVSLASSVVREGKFSGTPKDALASLEPFFAAVFDLGYLGRS